MSVAKKGLGSRLAPPRFVAFALIALMATPVGIALWGWGRGAMAGFDLAALIFLLSCIPLLDNAPGEMRRQTRTNDANRVGLLAITSVVTLVVLVAVASEMSQRGQRQPLTIALIIATLVIAWLFSNIVYALHYAHLFYSSGKDGDPKKDQGGIDFPDTKEPDYSDFIYFAFTLGMTFQTSDVDITSRGVRRVATVHCFAAFVFNIGVLAFTINVLGS